MDENLNNNPDESPIITSVILISYALLTVIFMSYDLFSSQAGLATRIILATFVSVISYCIYQQFSSLETKVSFAGPLIYGLNPLPICLAGYTLTAAMIYAIFPLVMLTIERFRSQKHGNISLESTIGTVVFIAFIALLLHIISIPSVMGTVSMKTYFPLPSDLKINGDTYIWPAGLSSLPKNGLVVSFYSVPLLLLCLELIRSFELKLPSPAQIAIAGLLLIAASVENPLSMPPAMFLIPLIFWACKSIDAGICYFKDLIDENQSLRMLWPVGIFIYCVDIAVCSKLVTLTVFSNLYR